MLNSQRQVAEALARAAFSGASDDMAAPDTLASFSIQDSSGPKLPARLLRLRTQVSSAPVLLTPVLL